MRFDHRPNRRGCELLRETFLLRHRHHDGGVCPRREYFDTALLPMVPNI